MIIGRLKQPPVTPDDAIGFFPEQSDAHGKWDDCRVKKTSHVGTGSRNKLPPFIWLNGSETACSVRLPARRFQCCQRFLPALVSILCGHS
jgi:hypothetical protein